jgi:hypothetical protein
MAQVVLRNNWFAPDGRFYTSYFPGPSEIPEHLLQFLPKSAVIYSGSHVAPSPNRPIMSHLVRTEETFDAEAYAKSLGKPAEPVVVEAAPAVDPLEAEQRRLEAEEAAAAAATSETAVAKKRK